LLILLVIACIVFNCVLSVFNKEYDDDDDDDDEKTPHRIDFKLGTQTYVANLPSSPRCRFRFSGSLSEGGVKCKWYEKSRVLTIILHYLGNDTKQDHTYCRTSMHSIEWCHFPTNVNDL